MIWPPPGLRPNTKVRPLPGGQLSTNILKKPFPPEGDGRGRNKAAASQAAGRSMWPWPAAAPLLYIMCLSDTAPAVCEANR
jgi:hypothetical protein